jgi:hypothetical protein
VTECTSPTGSGVDERSGSEMAMGNGQEKELFGGYRKIRRYVRASRRSEPDWREVGRGPTVVVFCRTGGREVAAGEDARAPVGFTRAFAEYLNREF